jgi:hypothetical protein
MSRLQEIATLPLDVVDDATPVEAAMQADGDEPGLAPIKRARSVINDDGSACFPGSGSMTVI